MSVIYLIIGFLGLLYIGYMVFAINRVLRKKKAMDDQSPLMEEYLKALAELESKKASQVNGRTPLEELDSSDEESPKNEHTLN